jgi:hypothetical protein
MLNYEVSSGKSVLVSYAGKTLAFDLHRLPTDWETLFRDPEIEQCVNETVLQKGAANAANAASPSEAGSWEDVSARLDELRGSTG